MILVTKNSPDVASIGIFILIHGKIPPNIVWYFSYKTMHCNALNQRKKENMNALKIMRRNTINYENQAV